jgi:hypothetical protein
MFSHASCIVDLQDCKKIKMRIPLFYILNQTGHVEYEMSLLDPGQLQETLNSSMNAIQVKVHEKNASPYLGLVYRNQYIQVFGFYSCTGWTMLVGFENGPYNGDEVCDIRFSSLILVGSCLRLCN